MAAISAGDIGKKVTIRLHDDGGYRDVVGQLLSPNTLRNRHGQIVEFDPTKIYIWREIEAKPRTATSGAPLSIRIYDLERTLNKTWQAKEELELGGWIFRADIGITKRANSALVLNQEDHIDAAIGWYRDRDLNPTMHLIPTLHEQLDEKLAKRGFKDSMDALVMVKDFDSDLHELNLNFEYEVTANPSDKWLATQGDEPIAQLMQRTPAKYISIKNDGKVIAVGRIGCADNWAVLARIWVEPELRGKGWGRRILSALEAEVDQPKIALQVAATNQTAINLYESFGYQIHHKYRFRALPQRIDLIQDLCC